MYLVFILVCKEKAAYVMRISDWCSAVCSSDRDASGSGRRRDHRHAGGAGAAHVGMDLVEDLLVVGVGVDGRHQPALDADRVVHHLGDRGQTVGRAGRIGDDRVIGRPVLMVEDRKSTSLNTSHKCAYRMPSRA